MDQARTSAANMLGGDKSYAAIPWFWSDQYDLKLQIAGLSEGHDEIVVRGVHHLQPGQQVGRRVDP